MLIRNSYRKSLIAIIENDLNISSVGLVSSAILENISASLSLIYFKNNEKSDISYV